MPQDIDAETVETKTMVPMDLEGIRAHKRDVNHKGWDDSNTSRQALILGGIGVLILIVAFALAFKAHRDIMAELNAAKLRLEKLEERFPQLVSQTIKLQHSVSKLQESAGSLTKQVVQLSREMDQLKKGTAGTGVKMDATSAVKKKPEVQAKPRYHVVSRGETLYRIAKQYGISVDELRRMNVIQPNQVIKAGQRLLVPPEGSQ
jgi:LysM repeat protein